MVKIERERIEMEESELEEGEACSYNITNDYGGSIDPDNDLTYIVRPFFLSLFRSNLFHLCLI